MSDFYDWFEANYSSKHIEDGDWQSHKLRGVEMAGSSSNPKDIADTKQTIEDACFVAWDTLQSRLEKAEAENKRLRTVLDDQIDTVAKAHNLVHKVEDENDVLKEALEFYANEMSYSIDDYHGASGEMRRRVVLYKDSEERNDYYSFAGKLARKTLRELDGVKE